MRAPRPTVTERILTRTLARALARGTKEHPELARPAGGDPEVRLVGSDPLRILIIGSGLAIGLGVPTHREALTGALAEAVQRRTGRGVVVRNDASDLRTVEQTVDALGTVGATSFGGVVWCPSLHDIVLRPDRGRYRAALTRGLALLRETALPGAPIVFCSLPPSTNAGPLEDIARTFVRRYRTGIGQAVAAVPGVHVADMPPFTSLADPLAFAGGYYRRWADGIVSTVALRAARSA